MCLFGGPLSPPSEAALIVISLPPDRLYPQTLCCACACCPRARRCPRQVGPDGRHTSCWLSSALLTVVSFPPYTLAFWLACSRTKQLCGLPHWRLQVPLPGIRDTSAIPVQCRAQVVRLFSLSLSFFCSALKKTPPSLQPQGSPTLSALPCLCTLPSFYLT